MHWRRPPNQKHVSLTDRAQRDTWTCLPNQHGTKKQTVVEMLPGLEFLAQIWGRTPSACLKNDLL
eukprot:3119740-Amphidinium_carterae.1